MCQLGDLPQSTFVMTQSYIVCDGVCSVLLGESVSFIVTLSMRSDSDRSESRAESAHLANDSNGRHSHPADHCSTSGTCAAAVRPSCGIGSRAFSELRYVYLHAGLGSAVAPVLAIIDVHRWREASWRLWSRAAAAEEPAEAMEMQALQTQTPPASPRLVHLAGPPQRHGVSVLRPDRTPAAGERDAEGGGQSSEGDHKTVRSGDGVSVRPVAPRLVLRWPRQLSDSQTNDNLKDDIEAYETQNKFLNSEIYQLTKWWRKSSEQEKALMVKAAFLEATSCQVESRYLGVLRRLQEIKSLDPAQREVVQKMIEDALKGELKSVTKLSVDRYKHLNSRMDKITETSCLFLIQESLDMTIKNSEEETLYRPNFLLFTPNLLNVLNIRRVLRDHDEYGFKII
ncbi:unnamed protein product [Oreochromis niloticus]|nr:unnamed protein product [Mustela putorius furo]